MSAETSPEKWADWCEDDGSFAICGTDMKEHHRESLGDRRCFTHRRRENFDYVVMVPNGLSYYGPTYGIKGPTSECTDLFPGWSRSWGEDG